MERTQKEAGDEIQLNQDAIADQIIAKEKVYAYEFEGNDLIGQLKFGFMKATIEYGLNQREMSSKIKRVFKKYYF